MKIVLLACSKLKCQLSDNEKVSAKDLYQGQIFKKSWIYANELIQPDKIFILSAKYGLLHPDDSIGIYDKTLVHAPVSEKKAWSYKVIEQMKSANLDLEKDEFIFLTGKDYYKYLMGNGVCQNYILPYKDNGCRGNGDILKWLKSKIMNNQLKNLDPVRKIRELKFEKKPGIYRWWFKKESAHQLLSQVSNLIDWEEIKKLEIDGKEYLALYFGMTKNVLDRFKWHISQEHLNSSIKAGTISTLRKTLSALLDTPLSESQDLINEFIDKNCYLEWEYCFTEKEADAREKLELNNNYYPLNIQDNKKISPELKDVLIKLRKEVGK